jgi:hypothetical protein
MVVKLRIVEIEGYEYELLDINNQRYKFNLEFIDIFEQPKVDDFIVMDECLLNPRYAGYSTSYTFGPMDSKYGKENVTQADPDFVVLIVDDEEIVLKRLYG